MSGPVESILALGGGLEERLSERREERERHTAQQPDAGSTREDTGPAPKRLIVCCDGTAKDGVNTEKPITNVARIARCIKNDDRGNNSGHPGPQIVFYLRGIGTGTSYLANLVDRVLGRGKPSCPNGLLASLVIMITDLRRDQQHHQGILCIPLLELEPT